MQGAEPDHAGAGGPQRLWQVHTIRFAAVAGVLLAAGYAAGWAGLADVDAHP